MNENRREFMKSAALAGGAVALMTPSIALAGKKGEAAHNKALGKAIEPGKHELPKLPYDYNALEPVIDAVTLETHHGKHHNGYVKGLNATELAIQNAVESEKLDDIPALERQLAFHSSGHVNHSLYWANMAPPKMAKGAPGGKLLRKINQEFGSFDKFKKLFWKASKTVEGNGWGILVYQPIFNRLYVLSALNHQNALMTGAVPLLICDVWEHAYYIKYHNRRGDYLTEWWKVVNWAEVEKRFEAALAS